MWKFNLIQVQEKLRVMVELEITVHLMAYASSNQDAEFSRD
jgi:hypothetical protein